MQDPRHSQIGVLSALLAYGIFGLDFDLRVSMALAILGPALGAQLAWARLRGERFDPRSALISSLSLCLLLRTDSSAIAAALAAATISSKYLLRWNGKHVFNPTTFGLALGLAASERVWVSAGQWGSEAWLALLVACAGLLVVRRAERSDVTWAFLAAWLLLLFGRALWLGDPPAVPLHALRSGALLIFAFFMLSDPRTTPASRAGRILFALAVALGAFAVQYGLHRPNGLIAALIVCATCVPLLDRLLPGRRYAWPGPEGEPHVQAPRARCGLRVAAAG